MITYKLKINYQDTKVLQSNIELVSGDVGACRLECEFFDDGKRTDISNYIITLKARRADGAILSEGGKIENNKGIIKLGNSIYSVPGELYLEIALTDSAKNYITTKIIIVNVIEGLGESSETSENTSSAYVTLLNQVKSRIDEVSALLSETQKVKEELEALDFSSFCEKTEKCYFVNGDEISVEDNTEYIADGEISSLVISYPEGDFVCSLYFSLASDGNITITLPESKYIGEVPTFTNGEAWELNIKNGVVVGGKIV